MAFRKAASLDDLWQGDMRAVTVGGRRVLLVHLADGVRAFEDRCLHKGVPLSAGKLAGCELTCAAHHWSYDVATGEGVNPRATRLRRFPVRIEGADVLVDVDPAEPTS